MGPGRVGPERENVRPLTWRLLRTSSGPIRTGLTAAPHVPRSRFPSPTNAAIFTAVFTNRRRDIRTQGTDVRTRRQVLRHRHEIGVRYSRWQWLWASAPPGFRSCSLWCVRRGLSLQFPEDLGDATLRALLNPDREPFPPDRHEPDWELLAAQVGMNHTDNDTVITSPKGNKVFQKSANSLGPGCRSKKAMDSPCLPVRQQRKFDRARLHNRNYALDFKLHQKKSRG